MALVDGNLGAAISRAQKMVDDAFKEHDKHVTAIIAQNFYLLEDSARLYEENAKLRELVYDMLEDEERGHNDDSTFYEHVERVNELGVEFRG